MASLNETLTHPGFSRRKFLKLIFAAGALTSGLAWLATIKSDTLPTRAVAGLVPDGKNVPQGEKISLSSEVKRQSSTLEVSRVVDDVFQGNDPYHEMVIRIKVDPDYRSIDIPVKDLVGRNDATRILSEYRDNIENNPGVVKLFEKFEPAVSTLNLVVQTIFDESEFKDGRYPIFTREWVRQNTVLVDDIIAITGGGLAPILDKKLPGIIIGPYGKKNFNERIITPVFVTNLAHETIGHPTQSYINNQAISPEEQERLFPIVHAFMGITFEDPARLSVNIADMKPDAPIIQAMKIMEESGMSPEEVVKLVARIGGGKMSDIYIAEKAYNEGLKRMNSPEPTFYDLIVNGAVPSRLADTQTLNHFRKIWAEMFKVEYKQYHGDLFNSWQILPTVKGWGEDDCLLAGSVCLDLTPSGKKKLFAKYVNRQKTDDSIILLRALTIPYDGNLYYLAEDLHRAWVTAGTPAGVTETQWLKILESASPEVLGIWTEFD